MSATPENPQPFQPQGPGSYQSGGNPPPQQFQQGSGSYPVGGQPPGSQPPPIAGKGRNTIAIVALVAAIVGFIFAVWEGAYLLGWVLLPIAFLLFTFFLGFAVVLGAQFNATVQEFWPARMTRLSQVKGWFAAQTEALERSGGVTKAILNGKNPLAPGRLEDQEQAGGESAADQLPPGVNPS